MPILGKEFATMVLTYELRYAPDALAGVPTIPGFDNNAKPPERLDIRLGAAAASVASSLFQGELRVDLQRGIAVLVDNARLATKYLKLFA